METNSNNSQCTVGCCKQKLTTVFCRAKALLLQPTETWKQIATENKSITELYKEYILILALLPALTGFLSLAVIGINVPFLGTYRAPLFSTLLTQAVSYVLMLGMLYVAAIVLEFFAPKFEATVSREVAFRLCAYSTTPLMVASILSLLPILALFAFAAAALYSIYLFWTGLGVLTQVPESRRIGYVLVSALSTFVIVVVFASIQAALSSPAIPPPSANYDELRDSMKQLFEHTLKDK
jgi:hypothetical protein